MQKEPYQPGDRVKNRNNNREGTVESVAGCRRRIMWDDARVTVTHIGDLAGLVH